MIVYKADRLLRMDPVAILDRVAVLVENRMIVWVGSQSDWDYHQARDHAEVVDLGDRTLMPGLIDAHVHLAFDGGPDPTARLVAETDTQTVPLMIHNARMQLSTGVTTLRDLGARGYTDVVVRDAFASGTLQGPRLLTAGAPITSTGGHCWYLGGEADSLDEVRKLVRQHHKSRVDHIKVMSTGGFMTLGSAPWFAQFTSQALRVIVEEAHRVGKRVAAHCHGTEGIRRALEAGVDTLEHCSFVEPDGTMGYDDHLGARIAEQGAYVSPTINVLLKALNIDFFNERMRRLLQAGAKIITSTDAGIDHVPHFAFPQSLPLYAEFGMSNADILRAATLTAAEALGIDHVTGNVVEGREADMIAVDGNPLERIDDVAKLTFVLARGERFHPDPVPALPELPPDFVAMTEKHRPAESPVTRMREH